MTSDLGVYEKWLIFNESYMDLMYPSTPKTEMWSTYMAMLSTKIWSYYWFQKVPQTTVYAYIVL